MLFRVQVGFAPGFEYGDVVQLDETDPEVLACVERGDLLPQAVLPDGGWRPGYSTLPPGTAAVPVDPAEFIEHVRSFDGVGDPTPRRALNRRDGVLGSFVPGQPETL